VSRAALSFARDRRGVTAVEFGLIAPMLMVGIMGLLDLAYNVYTDAQLQGAIQKAARDSTIEGATTQADTLDDRVEAAVKIIAPQATVTFSRMAYATFSDVRQPEDFVDSALNPNGVCDGGEPFEDANGNGVWDSDRGENGVGGARDAVLYTVTTNYPRAFPIGKLIGQDPDFTLVARTVLRNQPYNMQTPRNAVGNCV
jgi:Flp pilus assembly protein TadG